MAKIVLNKYLILLSLFISTSAFAKGACQPNCNAYADADRFQLTDYDTDVHLLIGYGATLTGSLILEREFGMERWKASLIMVTITILGATAKEVFHDEYTSGTDIKAYGIGAVGAGATINVFKF